MCQGESNPAEIGLGIRQLRMTANQVEQSIRAWCDHLEQTGHRAGETDLWVAAVLARSLDQVLGRAERAQLSGPAPRQTEVTVTPLIPHPPLR